MYVLRTMEFLEFGIPRRGRANTHLLFCILARFNLTFHDLIIANSSTSMKCATLKIIKDYVSHVILVLSNSIVY